jgi:hypothetical protein
MTSYMLRLSTVVFGSMIVIQTICAESTTKEKKEALENAQKALTDPKERREVMNSSPQAQMADNKVKDLLGGPENTDELYKLASDVLADLSKKANGDPEQLKKLLLEANQDPEKFYGTLGSTQKDKISDLSKKAEARKSPPSPP